MRDFRNAKSTYAVSMTITLAVIAVLVLSAPIRAVELSTSGFSGERLAGGDLDFSLQATFNTAEVIPFQHAIIDVTGPENFTCTIDIAGAVTAGPAACDSFTFSTDHTATYTNSTFGYGFGAFGTTNTSYSTQNAAFDSAAFGYGYGHGGAAATTLRWDGTWSTDGFAEGEYSMQFFVYADDELGTDYTYTTSSPSAITLSDLEATILSATSITPGSATLRATTNFAATCRWSTTSQSYASMPGSFSTTGGTTHTVARSGLSAATAYTYYIACNSGAASTAPQSTSFTTLPPPTSGGGGGGGGGAVTTPASSLVSFNLGNIGAGEGKQIVLNRAALAFTTISFESGTALAQNLVMNVRELTQTNVPSPLPRRAYQYLEVTYNSGFEAQNVEFNFRVDSDWLTENNIGPGDIALYRWQGNEWVELPTRRTGQESGTYTFTATSPGFSSFAVGEKETAETEPTPAPEPAPTPEPEPTPAPEPEPTPEPTDEQQPPVVDVTEEDAGSLTWLWALIGIIALVGILVGGGKYVKHRERVRAYNKYYEHKK